MTDQKPVTQSPKLSVTAEAEAMLLNALQKVNEGFLGGKLSKLELASWAIGYALEDLNDVKIEKIRKVHFNELAYLEAVLKQTRANGQDRLTLEQVAQLQSFLNPKAGKSSKP